MFNVEAMVQPILHVNHLSVGVTSDNKSMGRVYTYVLMHVTMTKLQRREMQSIVGRARGSNGHVTFEVLRGSP